MKWIGQHIYDQISRFRNSVYLEDISSGTIASGGNLGLDSNNKIVKATETTGDITGVDLTGTAPIAISSETGTTSGNYSATIGVSAASTSDRGVVELATTAETTTGTDTARAVTPDGLKDGYQGSTNVVTVGTISTGAWRGTAIDSAYLDADTAHLTTDQTFTGKKTFSDDVTFNCDNITFQSANADDPNVLIKNTTDDNQAARLTFMKDRGAAMGDNDRVAEIDFIGEDASQNTQGYGKIMCQALESDNGVETGAVKIQAAEYDGTLTNGLIVAGGTADGVVNVTLGAGAASTTTVAGDLAVTTGLILDSVDVTAIQTSSESFSNDDTSIMTSAAIEDKIQTTLPTKSLHYVHGDLKDTGSDMTNEHFLSLGDADRESTSELAVAIPIVIPGTGVLKRVIKRTQSDFSAKAWSYKFLKAPSGTALGSASLMATVTKNAGGAANTNSIIDFTTDASDAANACTFETGFTTSTQFSVGDSLLFSYQCTSGSGPSGTPKIVWTLVFELDDTTAY